MKRRLYDMGAGSLRGFQQCGFHSTGIRNHGGVTSGKLHRDMTAESKDITHDSYSPRIWAFSFIVPGLTRHVIAGVHQDPSLE